MKGLLESFLYFGLVLGYFFEKCGERKGMASLGVGE